MSRLLSPITVVRHIGPFAAEEEEVEVEVDKPLPGTRSMRLTNCLQSCAKTLKEFKQILLATIIILLLAFNWIFPRAFTTRLESIRERLLRSIIILRRQIRDLSFRN